MVETFWNQENVLSNLNCVTFFAELIGVGKMLHQVLEASFLIGRMLSEKFGVSTFPFFLFPDIVS